jgi:hypothetical protein
MSNINATNNPDLLRGFTEQKAWAERHNITARTAARYRQSGLPWLRFGGRVLIGPAEAAAEWLRSQVQYSNKPAKRRRA